MNLNSFFIFLSKKKYLISIFILITIYFSLSIHFLYISNPSYVNINLLLLITLYSLLITTLYLTISSPLSTIPNEQPWLLSTSSSSPSESLETSAFSIINIQQALQLNHNKLYMHELSNDSSFTFNEDVPKCSSSDYITLHQRQINNSNELRICYTCKKIKPDRTHHCKYCNECYLKMDHHCFWLDKCITISNYKNFILFVFYSFVVLVMFIWMFYHKGIHSLIWWLFLCGSGLLCISVFSLLMFHVNLSASNFTTFEYYTLKKQIEKNKTKEGKVYKYWEVDSFVDKRLFFTELKSMFDKGKFSNLCDVFGDNVLMWLVPEIKKKDDDNNNKGKGINFGINEEFEMEIIKSI